MKRYFCILLLLMAMVASVFAEDDKEVLVVCPYRPSGIWGRTIVSPILSLEEEYPNLRMSCTVIRNSSMTNVDEFEEQVKGITDRYATRRPDLIVIYGPGNYIVSDMFDQKWKDVPQMLIGELNYVCDVDYVIDSVARKDARRVPFEQFRGNKNIMLLHTPVYCDETLDLINSMTYSMRELVFVGGEEFLSRELQLECERITAKSGLAFKPFIANVNKFKEVEDYLHHADFKNTGVLYCNWHRKHGTDSSEHKTGVIRDVQKLAPTYNIYYTDMSKDSEIVGFVSYDYDQYVFQARGLIHEFLYEKMQPRTMPTVTIRRQPPVINEEALVKWSMDTDLIPSHATVLRKVPDFWERHAVLILLASLVLAFLVTVFIYRLYRKQVRLLGIASRFQTLVEDAPFEFNKGVLIYDDKGNIVDFRSAEVNKALQKKYDSFGLEVGKRTFCEAYPQSAPDLIKAINQGYKENKKSVRATFNIKEFGQYYEMLVIFDLPINIYTVAINTTELMNAKADLEKAKEQAERSDLIKTQFIQNMSHEIRTPMNAIVGFSQLLSLPDGFNTDQEKVDFAGYIMNNSEILIMLIDDILDMTDLENGNFHISLCDAHINQICQKALKTVEHRVLEGVNLYYTTDVDDNFTCYTDPKRVQQVLINYLSNACKHTETGEIHLECSTKENPGRITLSVTDTGPGVPPEMAENIFERFTKLDAFKQGSGLGLNICRSIAGKLNGEVKLDTSYTGGARFVFII